MPSNLLESVKNFFTADFVSNSATNLGENAAGISKALTAIAPAGLAAACQKATSGPEGAENVYGIAKSNLATADTTMLTSSENVQNGNGIVNKLFGPTQSTVVNAVAGFANIKESSVSTLMSMVLPAVMGILGKHAQENNLSASGLAGFLSSQKDNIIHALPSGMQAVAGLPDNSLTSTAEKTVSELNETHAHPHSHEITTISERPTAKWLVPLVVIVAILLMLWAFSRGCGETKTTPAAQDSTAFNIHYRAVNIDFSHMLLIKS